MNEELIRRTMAHIRLDTTLWDQDNFSEITACGTSACFAGWALMLSGFVPLEGGDMRSPSGTVVRWRDDGIEDAANTYLGLSEYDGRRIYYYWPDLVGQDEWDGKEPEEIAEIRASRRPELVELMAARVMMVTGLDGL